MISIPSTFRISLRALRVNKMRSALTMLGIIIGVGAVITMLAVGTGARERISAQMASIGSNLLIVLPGSSTSGGIRMGSGTQSTLTLDDADSAALDAASRPVLGFPARFLPRSVAMTYAGMTIDGQSFNGSTQ